MTKIISVNTNEKTFTVAGVSDLNGVYKLRVANSTDRVKVLMRNGHEDIRLIELPRPMTKLEAVNYLLDLPTNDAIDDQSVKDLFIDVDAQQAFADFLGKTLVVPKAVAAEVFDEVDYTAAADALEAELAAA